MSLRTPAAAFKRQKNEAYYTPPSASRPVLHWLNQFGLLEGKTLELWEPAAGAGDIAHEVQHYWGLDILATDLNPARNQVCPVTVLDFLSAKGPSGNGPLGIITNPPYGHHNRAALAFMAHGLEILEQRLGFMALLLPFEIDTRKSRNPLFADHHYYAGKLTLGERVRWLNLPQSPNDPMGSHSWFIWATDERKRRMIRLECHGRVI